MATPEGAQGRHGDGTVEMSVAEGRLLSRRKSLSLGATGTAIGLTSLVLPASPASASYEGYGATMDYSTGFGVVSGFGDADGKYFTSSKVSLAGLAPGITQVRITVVGAAGAASTALGDGTTRGAPGKGAIAQAVFPLSSVITSTHLHLYVGGRGGASSFPKGAGAPGGTGMPNISIQYYGGSGNGSTGQGGGGGAASVVFLGNGTSNSTVIAVAGGGGGGGGGTATGLSTAPTSAPGGAGGHAGRTGLAGASINSAALGGAGATGTSAGSAGTGSATVGTSGSGTNGGSGGNTANGGGGGGGGRFGGGGGAGNFFGAGGGGGGGGSSFLLSVADGASDHYYGTNSTAEAGWIKLEFK